MCHFDSVAVAMADPGDITFVRHKSGLPIFDVLDLSGLVRRPSSTGLVTISVIQVGMSQCACKPELDSTSYCGKSPW